jgi:(p)ppGpp synthase/HD superfamily hydrolase
MSLAPSPRLAERFAEALTLTVELHSNQSRKRTPTPYLGHLLGVASIVIDSGGDDFLWRLKNFYVTGKTEL